MPPAQPIFLWRTLTDRAEPSTSLKDGLVHVSATLEECVNFAFLMGWKAIVLAGVDLYDRRYFWLPPDQPGYGDTTTDIPHRTASTGIVDSLGAWRDRFAAEGVQLFVHNPRSLLTSRLPVWRADAGQA